MDLPRPRERTLRAVLGGAMLVAAIAATAASQELVSGTTYRITVTVVEGLLGAENASRRSHPESFSATVEVAAGRGRIDFIPGRGRPPFVADGDHILFDSTGLIVVRPGARQFFSVDTSLADLGMDILRSAGVSLTSRVSRDSLTSLGSGDSVAGYPTVRLRSTTTSNLMLAIDGIPPDEFESSLGTQRVTTTYWLADVQGVPNPFVERPIISGRAVDSATARAASGTALRTHTVTERTFPQGAPATQRIAEMTDLRAAPVDLNRLVLADGFVEVRGPGSSTPRIESDAARRRAAYWRAKPGRTP